jgi:hypothetical protein
VSKSKPKPPTLDELDARVRALESHNGWKPGECPPPSDYIGSGQPSSDETDGETRDEPKPE